MGNAIAHSPPPNKIKASQKFSNPNCPNISSDRRVGLGIYSEHSAKYS